MKKKKKKLYFEVEFVLEKKKKKLILENHLEATIYFVKKLFQKYVLKVISRMLKNLFQEVLSRKLVLVS